MQDKKYVCFFTQYPFPCSCWKLGDWPTESQLLQTILMTQTDLHDPRLRIYEAMVLLQNLQQSTDNATKIAEAVVRVIERGTQWAMIAWASLPEIVSQPHLSLLQTFQQFVELQESITMYQAILPPPTSSHPNPGVPQMVQDLKGTLSTWRERLPNKWDPINVWTDLLTWRQHVFTAINTVFQLRVPMADPSAAVHAYLGYHETVG